MAIYEVSVMGSEGHAKVALAAIHAIGWRVKALYDDDPSKVGQRVLGECVVGPPAMDDPCPWFLGLDDNRARRSYAGRIAVACRPIIHPGAIVDRSVRLGVGAIVMAGAVVQADARIGDHAIVNTMASVDHDCVVEQFSHIGPGARLAGNVTVREGALIGVGASTKPGIEVGAWSTVGAGAAVIRHVEPGTTVGGTPARVLRR